MQRCNWLGMIGISSDYSCAIYQLLLSVNMRTLACSLSPQKIRYKVHCEKAVTSAIVNRTKYKLSKKNRTQNRQENTYIRVLESWKNKNFIFYILYITLNIYYGMCV
jgi:hypothetical protein